MQDCYEASLSHYSLFLLLSSLVLSQSNSRTADLSQLLSPGDTLGHSFSLTVNFSQLITVTNISSNLSVRHQSGNLSVRHQSGNLSARHQSGNFPVRHQSGNRMYHQLLLYFHGYSGNCTHTYSHTCSLSAMLTATHRSDSARITTATLAPIFTQRLPWQLLPQSHVHLILYQLPQLLTHRLSQLLPELPTHLIPQLLPQIISY